MAFCTRIEKDELVVFTNSLLAGVLGSTSNGGGDTPSGSGKGLKLKQKPAQYVQGQNALSYLYRDFSTGVTPPTDSKVWTYSAWLKLSSIGGTGYPQDSANKAWLSAAPTSDTGHTVNNSAQLILEGKSPVFQSPLTPGITDYWTVNWNSADVVVGNWYHYVITCDTDNAYPTAPFNIYIDNSLLSVNTSTLPVEGSDVGINADTGSDLTFYIGIEPKYGTGGTGSLYGWPGYISDTHFIDGQVLTPSDFAETNSDGDWVPKTYTGTYGNNGFWLKFEDDSSLAALGTDSSGNSNDFTPDTGGVGIILSDSVPDCPENNYAILNIEDSSSSTTAPPGVSHGLAAIDSAGLMYWTVPDESQSTIMRATGISEFNSGKWYWEILPMADGEAVAVSDGFYLGAGISNPTDDITNATGSDGININLFYRNTHGQTGDTAHLKVNGSSGNTGGREDLPTLSHSGNPETSDWPILMIAINMDTGKAWFGKNGTWFVSGDPAAGTGATYDGGVGDVPALSGYFRPLIYSQSGPLDPTAQRGRVNFGADPTFQGHLASPATSEFYYTAPTGFKSLSASNK